MQTVLEGKKCILRACIPHNRIIQEFPLARRFLQLSGFIWNPYFQMPNECFNEWIRKVFDALFRLKNMPIPCSNKTFVEYFAQFTEVSH